MASPAPDDISVIELRNKCFIERAESGLYASALAQMKELPNALANIEYIGTKSPPPRHLQRSRLGEKSIIGEIAEPTFGTLVRAHGNHYDGRDGEPFKPVDDKSKIKDVLVLRAPTHSDLEMHNLYENQTALLQDIENTEIATDEAHGFSPNYRSCLRSSRTDMDCKDLLTITTMKKYRIPAAAGGAKIIATPKRVQRVKRKFGVQDDEDGEPIEATTSAVEDNNDSKIKYPSDDEVKLGAFYDPRVLEDFGGDYFSLVNAKLVQLDIRDADNKLIPPWKQYEALRPGSLIIALVSIHIFTFKDAGADRSRDRKMFQLNAHTIRVLESDFAVQTRNRPVPRTMEDGPTTAGPSTPGRSSTGFNSFTVTPRSSPKKAVVTDGGDELPENKRDELPENKKSRRSRK
ncbi:hypothetical protein B0H10DRAFT_417881 [Mycena sp. CBHHK59/15]|nr:hypothetical protein B0H10DRAFT_417881 [Mycena sp. CBHHK59/15]